MKLFAYLLVFLMLSSSAFAALTTRKIVSPRSAGLGSAIHGNIGSNDTLRDNPASIAFSKNYGIEGLYINSATDQATILDVSVVDSKTSHLAGGFAYSKISEQNNLKRDMFYLCVAERYWQKTALSLGGKYVKTTIDKETISFYDFDLGLLMAFNNYLGLGLVWKNIRKKDETFAPQEVSLGLQGAWTYFYPTFTVSKLTKTGFSKLNALIYAMGLEVTARNKIFARGGYNIDTMTDIKKYSLGVGWNAPKISFSYAFERALKKASLYQHLASIRLYF